MQPPLGAVDMTRLGRPGLRRPARPAAGGGRRPGRQAGGRAHALRPARVPRAPALTRVALISDAHGNAVGLRAALDDIAGRDVDEIVALGDMARAGRSRSSASTCCAAPARASSWATRTPSCSTRTRRRRSRPSGISSSATGRSSQLSEDDLAYIRSFEPTVELDLDGTRLLCFHGAPGDFDEVVLPEDPPDAFTGADLLAGGHVHVPQLRRVGEAVVRESGQRRPRLRPPPARRRLPLRPVGLVRDPRRAVSRVPPGARSTSTSSTRSRAPAAMPLAGEVFDRYRR